MRKGVLLLLADAGRARLSAAPTRATIRRRPARRRGTARAGTPSPAPPATRAPPVTRAPAATGTAATGQRHHGRGRRRAAGRAGGVGGQRWRRGFASAARRVDRRRGGRRGGAWTGTRRVRRRSGLHLGCRAAVRRVPVPHRPLRGGLPELHRRRRRRIRDRHRMRRRRLRRRGPAGDQHRLALLLLGSGERRRTSASAARARRPASAAAGPRATARCCPSGEACNGEDDDCDGRVDDGPPSIACGVGACARQVRVLQRRAARRLPSPAAPAAPTTAATASTTTATAWSTRTARRRVRARRAHRRRQRRGRPRPSRSATSRPRSTGAAMPDPRSGCASRAARPAATAALRVAGRHPGRGHGRRDLRLRQLRVDDLDALLAHAGAGRVARPDGHHPDPDRDGRAVPVDGQRRPRRSTGSRSPGTKGDALASTAAVTVDGAKQVTLSNLVINDAPTPMAHLGHQPGQRRAGADHPFDRRRRRRDDESIAIRSVGVAAHRARELQQLDPTTGRCATAPARALGLRGRNTTAAATTAGIGIVVLLKDSPGAVVERNLICGGPGRPSCRACASSATAARDRRPRQLDAGAGRGDRVARRVDGGVRRRGAVDRRQRDHPGRRTGGRVGVGGPGGRRLPPRDRRQRPADGRRRRRDHAGRRAWSAPPPGRTVSRCAVVGNKLIQGATSNHPTLSVGVACDDGGCVRVAGNVINGNHGGDAIGRLDQRRRAVRRTQQHHGRLRNALDRRACSPTTAPGGVENNLVRGAVCANSARPRRRPSACASTSPRAPTRSTSTRTPSTRAARAPAPARRRRSAPATSANTARARASSATTSSAPAPAAPRATASGRRVRRSSRASSRTTISIRPARRPRSTSTTTRRR